MIGQKIWPWMSYPAFLAARSFVLLWDSSSLPSSRLAHQQLGPLPVDASVGLWDLDFAGYKGTRLPLLWGRYCVVVVGEGGGCSCVVLRLCGMSTINSRLGEFL